MKILLLINDHVNKVTSKISKSVGVMRRFRCQLPTNINGETVLFVGVFPSDLCFTGMGRSGRTNAAEIECAHRRARILLTEHNQKILTFHKIYDYFAALNAFNTNNIPWLSPNTKEG